MAHCGHIRHPGDGGHIGHVDGILRYRLVMARLHIHVGQIGVSPIASSLVEVQLGIVH